MDFGQDLISPCTRINNVHKWRLIGTVFEKRLAGVSGRRLRLAAQLSRLRAWPSVPNRETCHRFVGRTRTHPREPPWKQALPRRRRGDGHSEVPWCQAGEGGLSRVMVGGS